MNSSGQALFPKPLPYSYFTNRVYELLQADLDSASLKVDASKVVPLDRIDHLASTLKDLYDHMVFIHNEAQAKELKE